MVLQRQFTRLATSARLAHRLGVVAILGMVAVLIPLQAAAAGGPAGQTGRFVAPQGWALQVPPGLGAVWQAHGVQSADSARSSHTAQAARTAQAAGGTLLLVHGGTEVLRLDLYADTTRRSPLQWVRDELPLAIHGARLQDGLATTANVPCTVAELERSPQRHAQRLVFFRLGGQIAQLTCQIGSGPAAAGWCEAVRSGLEPPANPPAPPANPKTPPANPQTPPANPQNVRGGGR